MSAPEMIAALRELASYNLIEVAADDEELTTALAELSLCDSGEDGD